MLYKGSGENSIPQCRWVDYVGKYDKDINGNSNGTGFYRLAFK